MSRFSTRPNLGEVDGRCLGCARLLAAGPAVAAINLPLRGALTPGRPQLWPPGVALAALGPGEASLAPGDPRRAALDFDAAAGLRSI
mmetsp:Transcript_91160/g.181257  ORF Transcript_91160/g.181257 Transcript_91160/m.181257 type:complete len:87 (+) Transcript_91160:547-807(+)